MITTYKIFEGKNTPKVGDYVIIADYDESEPIINNFLSLNIGEIVKESDESLPYKVVYKIPKKIHNIARLNMLYSTGTGYRGDYYLEIYVNNYEIDYFSSNKKDCLTKIEFIKQTNKYNL